MRLSDIKNGETVRIVSVGGAGSLRQHFLDMGVIPGKKITYVKAAPLGDPIQYRIWGYELTLRIDDAKNIEVEPIAEEDPLEQAKNPCAYGGDPAKCAVKCNAVCAEGGRAEVCRAKAGKELHP